MTRGKARQLRAKIDEQASVFLPDVEALEAVELFPAWSGDGAVYAVNTRLRFESSLYRVVQDHTSQPDWPPDRTPALYTPVAVSGEVPVWRRPTGTQDAYGLGDKVRYPDAAGPVWTSTVAANTWEPGVYGWEQTD